MSLKAGDPLAGRNPSHNRFSSSTFNSVMTALPGYTAIADSFTVSLSEESRSQSTDSDMNTTRDVHVEGTAPSLRSTPSYSTLVPSGHSNRTDRSDTESIMTLAPSVNDDRALPTGRRMPPPRYSSVFNTDPAAQTLLRNFPFSYAIGGGRKGTPWATLYIRDRRPLQHQRQHSSTSSLKVRGGDFLEGVLDLKLENPQSIVSIKLNLKGKVVTGYLADNGCTMIDHSTTIWDKFRGDPKNPSPGVPFNGKLSPGSYQFLFNFLFPTHVNIVTLKGVYELSENSDIATELRQDTVTPFLQTQRPSRFGSFLRRSSTTRASATTPTSSVPTYVTKVPANHLPDEDDIHRNFVPTHPDAIPLPPTILESAVNANTKYELHLVINHGKLRSESRVKVPIVYTGCSEYPPPLPAKRKLAYQNRTPIPSPLADPQGWYTLPSVTISGTLSGQRRVEAQCTLSLARPLLYSRGSVVPIHLSISCPEATVLEHIASPHVQHARLTRTVRYNAPVDDARSAPPPSPFVEPGGGIGAAVGLRANKRGGGGPRDMVKTVTPFSVDPSKIPQGLDESQWDTRDSITVATARWWGALDRDDENCRTLQGEIHLPGSLHPSCHYPSFHISYAVELLAFDSPLFEPDRNTPSAKGSQRSSVEDDQESLERVYQSQLVNIVSKTRTDEPLPILYQPPSSPPPRSHQRHTNKTGPPQPHSNTSRNNISHNHSFL